jgi:transcriptional regulator with XRE-family HTH domain
MPGTDEARGGAGPPIRLTADAIERRLRDGPGWSRPRDPVAVAVGAALARRRQARGLSQMGLADLVGCDHSTIARWEAGRRTPTIPHLLTLARALGCRPGALLPDEWAVGSGQSRSEARAADGAAARRSVVRPTPSPLPLVRPPAHCPLPTAHYPKGGPMPQTTDVEIGGAGYMLAPGTYRREQDGLPEGRPGRVVVRDFFGGQRRAVQLERDRGWDGLGVGPAYDGQTK